MEEIERYRIVVDSVKRGYSTLVNSSITRQVDDSVPLFREFTQKLTQHQNGKVLELGCGNGDPGQEITQRLPLLSYVGVDLTQCMIETAKERYRDNPKCTFVCDEMLNYILHQEKNSFVGILSLFSIYHVPRTFHVELFTEIFRILKPNGYLLFSTPKTARERAQDNWLGVWMYWSNFSHEWYEITLKEIGFSLYMKCVDSSEVFGETQNTVYYIYQKPDIQDMTILSGYTF